MVPGFVPSQNSMARGCLCHVPLDRVSLGPMFHVLFVHYSSMPSPEELNKEMRHADLFRGVEKHRHGRFRFGEEVDRGPHGI